MNTTNNGRTFEQWKRLVDAMVWKVAGCSADDLPDCCYYDWFANGKSPAAAARKAIRLAGGEF